jgi:hypothetical protein
MTEPVKGSEKGGADAAEAPSPHPPSRQDSSKKRRRADSESSDDESSEASDSSVERKRRKKERKLKKEKKKEKKRKHKDKVGALALLRPLCMMVLLRGLHLASWRRTAAHPHGPGCATEEAQEVQEEQKGLQAQWRGGPA